MPRSLLLLTLLLTSLAGPAHLAAQDIGRPESDSPRVLVGIEADVFFAVSSPYVDRYLPGPSLSASVQFSITKWLMPLFRVRGGFLTQATNTDLGTFGSALAGIRFRPRGIAHPEEVPRATCVWAEVDAGIVLWNGLARPTFEAAVGFTFEAGEVGLGPVVRVQHVLPTEPSDGPDPFLMTVGIEVLLGDAHATDAGAATQAP